MKPINNRKTKTQPKKNNSDLPQGIRYHQSGKFIVDVCVRGTRKARTFATLDEAIIGRAILQGEIEDAFDRTCPMKPKTLGKINRLETWTMEQAVAKTRALVWDGRGGEQAALRNAYIAMNFFGPKAYMYEITPDRIDDFVDHLLKQGNSGGTINRKLSALSRILRTAVERGKLHVIPKMPKRREGEHRIRFLTPTEEVQLLTVAEQLGYADHKDAIHILIYTGFRCGELWRLECRDIDLEHDTMTAWKTKGGHPRTIPIVDDIRPIIERRVAAAGGSGRIFPQGSNAWLRSPWERIRLHMGCADDPQFVPHMLRHTCASRLAQRGVTMMIIKEWMGHSTIQTTARYTHLAPKDLYNAAKLLSNT